MGTYITAYVKTFGKNAGRKFFVEWFKNFAEHLGEACLGQVSEIFDGNAPHASRGCVAQAWSVAELLRAAVEDLYQVSGPILRESTNHSRARRAASAG